MQPEVQDNFELTDAQLANMAKHLDRDAFGELTQRHRHRCANVASILRDADEAEEETQNACHTEEFQRRRCRQRHSTPTVACAHMLTAGGPVC